jgi:AcrR family transcriptional regulator
MKSSTDGQHSQVASQMPVGKRSLMDAALRTLASQRASETLSLRLIAREARLNHNTFYRHFTDVDHMLTELMHEAGDRLRAGISGVRSRLVPGEAPTRSVLQWLLEFARQHESLFLATYRTLHGPPCEARRIVEDCIDALVEEMRRELQALRYLPDGDDELWQEVLDLYVRRVFQLVVAQLESRSEVDDLLERCQRLLLVLVRGVTGAHQPADEMGHGSPVDHGP